MYYQCKKCLYIIDANKKQNNKVCIKCGNSLNNEWLEFPAPAASGFMNQAAVNIYDDDMNPYDFHELQSGCLFLCALYEILLMGLISNLMHSINTPMNVVNMVLESSDGQAKLSNVFKSLSGTSIKDGMNLSGDKKIYDYMNEIIKGRNKYIHGDYSGLDHIQKERAQYIYENIIETFVFLHNNYCVKDF